VADTPISPEPKFTSLTGLRRFALADPVSARALRGQGAMIKLVALEPGALVARHSLPTSSSAWCCAVS
jgi:hypothetical protein